MKRSVSISRTAECFVQLVIVGMDATPLNVMNWLSVSRIFSPHQSSPLVNHSAHLSLSRTSSEVQIVIILLWTNSPLAGDRIVQVMEYYPQSPVLKSRMNERIRAYWIVTRFTSVRQPRQLDIRNCTEPLDEGALANEKSTVSN
jgi:hypothetical protein